MNADFWDSTFHFNYMVNKYHVNLNMFRIRDFSALPAFTLGSFSHKVKVTRNAFQFQELLECFSDNEFAFSQLN